nr:hypothetical protein [uncultured Holophaga sp.]
MRRLALFLLPLLFLGCSGSPLRVASVERSGPPPYEPGDRTYKVVGDGWEELRVGSSLDLHRPGTRKPSGRLVVYATGTGYVLARLATEGETYPLVGDLASSRDIRPRPLPEWPATAALPLPRLDHMEPATPHSSLALFESIFFVKGDGTLSPGGTRKVGAWVQAYGREGLWFLQVPKDPRVEEPLVQARCKALKDCLLQLGVRRVEIRTGAFEDHERYDLIHVGWQP